ncbi:hypothetical protein [Methylomonas methanica]|uniref:Uncharacterized protein n=1 Tax=Methylomonas methanica (strain DSM 25384 / MC09) TaxID=857087 RepID=F9ZVC5_METMM|nr:hypothetical protein [Methylomonas methanica]AEG00735.1 hypothetical protein Metme_2333 [Methylomonas methanica MC09]
MSVVAKLFFIWFFLFSSQAYSDSWFSSMNTALAACQSANNITSNCYYRSINNDGVGICSDGSSSNFYYPAGSAVNYKYCGSAVVSCPSGQTRNIPGDGLCSCPSGQVYENGVCVVPIVQNCPSGQYRNFSNLCVAVPNCWTNNPQYEASFFDVESGSCMEYTGTISICIGGNPKYCAPLSDCQKSTDICSNNQVDIDANNARQAVVTPVKKTEATASAQTADNAKNDALAASSAKQAAAQAAQQNNEAAQSAANSNPTMEALSAAATAATQAAAAAAQAANAAASAQTTQGYAAEAAAARDEITPSYPPGRAENAAESAALAAGKAVADALKAIQGQAPDGNGTGEDMGTCPECAKESTLQSFKAGDGESLTPGSSSQFDDSVVDSETTAAKTAYTDKVAQIKTQFGQLIDIQLTGVGELPVFDYGTIKGVHVVNDFSRFTDLITIGNIILFIAGFLALRIILDF